MRAIRLLIPLIAYVITAAAGFVLNQYEDRLGREIYEEAVDGNLPLIVTWNEKGGFHTFRLHSIDGRTVGLIPPCNGTIGPMGLSHEEGRVYFKSIAMSDPYFWLCVFNLPERDYEISGKFLRDELFDPVENIGSERLNVPWWMNTGDDGVSIVNGVTEERIHLGDMSDMPWDAHDFLSHSAIRATYLPGSNQLFVLDGGSIWKYDIGSDEWSEVAQFPNNTIDIVYSPDGNGYAVETLNSYTGSVTLTLEFIDFETGDILKTVTNAGSPFIGIRWAACVVYPSLSTQTVPQHTMIPGPLVVKIFDLHNDWEEYEFVLDEDAYPPRSNFAVDLVLLEPSG